MLLALPYLGDLRVRENGFSMFRPRSLVRLKSGNSVLRKTEKKRKKSKMCNEIVFA